MELKWIEDFLSIAETRSFSRSAELRHVTQSAFSRRIRALEVWLGTALLDRSTYPIALTPDGRHFVSTADEVVQLLKASRTDPRGGGGAAIPSRPVLAITALHALAASVLPDLIIQLREAVGPFGSRILPENATLGVAALMEGSYDVMLTYYRPDLPRRLDPERFSWVSLGRDSLVAVAAPTGLTPDPEGRLPLLQYSAQFSQGTHIHRMIEFAQAFAPAPATYPDHVFENSMPHCMLSMAVRGLGVAWLPRSLVQAELESGALVVLGGGAEMDIRLYRDAERPNPFIDQLWKAASDLRYSFAA